MSARLYDRDDFEADVTIFSEAGGGRRTPAFNGIRWDFSYANDDAEDGIYMIWPDFVDDDGDSLATDGPLPVGVTLRARFMICNDRMVHVHQQRIETGLHFYCQEGAKRVANGKVTRITGLHDDHR